MMVTATDTACGKTAVAPGRGTKGRWLGKVMPVIPCLCLVICIAFAHPFGDTAFNDDWSYAEVALKFARTGRFLYNGWGSPMILPQTLWGALWIRCFGFSFDTLRLSTIPIALVFVFLVYSLGRKVGLRQDLSTFAAMLIATSPLFLPLSASFMTDVYGGAFTLAGIYAAIASAHSTDKSSALKWLYALAAIGAIGGAERQIVWAVPLSLIPYLWLKKSGDRRFGFHAAVAYALLSATIGVCLLQFSQPYSPMAMPGSALMKIIKLQGLLVPFTLAFLGLSAAFSGLPVLLASCGHLKSLGGRGLIRYSVLCVAGTWVLHHLSDRYALAPFLGNLLTPYGIMDMQQDALGPKPIVMPFPIRLGLTWVTLLAIMLCAFSLGRGRLPRITVHIFAISGLSYLFLLMPGMLLALTYDRYLVPLLPLAAILILLSFQRLNRPLPIICWVSAILFGAYGVASTHDYFSALRARVDVASNLQTLGIARNQISAGFEYDGWTQMASTGSIKTFRYDEVAQMGDPEKYWFWVKTTAITPKYVVAYRPVSMAFTPGLFSHAYEAWLPPFHRAVVALAVQDVGKLQPLARTQ